MEKHDIRKTIREKDETVLCAGVELQHLQNSFAIANGWTAATTTRTTTIDDDEMSRDMR